MNNTKVLNLNIISMKVVQNLFEYTEIFKRISIKSENRIETKLISFSDIPKFDRDYFTKNHLKTPLFIKDMNKEFIYEMTHNLKKKYGIDIKIIIEKTSIIQLLLSNEIEANHGKHESNYFSIIYHITRKGTLISSRYKIFENLDKEIYLKFIDELDEEINFFLNVKKRNVELSLFDKFVFSSQAAAYFIHESVGHFLECDYYKISPIRNTNMTIKGLTIYENCLDKENQKDQLGDNIDHNIKLVDNGKIVNLLSNRFFSKLFNIHNSGNSIYSFNPSLVRMRKMKVEIEKKYEWNSVDNKTCIIEEILNGDVNPLYGYFSIIVLKAKNSSGEYFEPFTLHFNVRKFESYSVGSMGNKENFIGLCGKFDEVIPVHIEAPPIIIFTNEKH